MKAVIKILIVAVLAGSLFFGFLVATPSERLDQDEVRPSNGFRHVKELIINNETQLLSFVRKFGFDGNGTRDDPIVIEGLVIDEYLSISNVDAWFLIRNISSKDYGFMSLTNVSGVVISDVQQSSLFLRNVGSISIENFRGSLDISNFGNASEAVIRNSRLDGLYIFGRRINVTIESSKISGSFNGMGIDGLDVEVRMNNCEIYNSYYGIIIYAASQNDTEVQVRLYGRRIIFHNNEIGLRVSIWFIDYENEVFRVKVELEYSLFEANSEAGVLIEENITGVKITNSTFVNNWKHIVDNGFDNIYLYNYYDGFGGPDKNGDGIIDMSYRIDGSSGSVDPKPLVNPPVAPRGYRYWWNYFLDATVFASFIVVGVVTILAAKKKWDRSKCLKRYEEVKKIWLQ